MDQISIEQQIKREAIAEKVYYTFIMAIPVISWLWLFGEAFKIGGKSKSFIAGLLKIFGLALALMVGCWIMLYMIAEKITLIIPIGLYIAICYFVAITWRKTRREVGIY